MTLGLGGPVAVFRLRFARAGRARRRHLARAAGAAVLAAVAAFALLQAADAQSRSYAYVGRELSGTLAAILAVYATLAALEAGGEHAGAERERALGQVLLTHLGPGRILLASWLSLLAKIVLGGLTVLPALAALSLIGGLEPAGLVRWLLEVLFTAMLVSALGLALSLGASSVTGGVLRTLAAALELPILLLLPALAWGGQRGEAWAELVGYALPVPIDHVHPGRELAVEAAVAVAGSALLLAWGRGRIRRHFRVDRAVPLGARLRAWWRRRLAPWTVPDRRRAPRPVGDDPLQWLLESTAARSQRRAQSSIQWTIALFIGILLWQEGWSVLAEPSVQVFLLCVTAFGAAILAALIPLSFWSGLRARGLFELLAASPLEARDFLIGSLRATYIPVRLGLIAVVAGGVATGIANHAGAVRIAAALLAFLGAVAMIAVAAVAAGIGSRPRESALRLGMPALLGLAFGGAVLFVLGAIAEEGIRMRHIGFDPGVGQAAASVVFAGALLLALHLVGHRDVRARVLQPVAALLLAGMLLALVTRNEWAPQASNPWAVGFAGLFGLMEVDTDLAGLAAMGAVLLPAAAATTAAWVWWAFDDSVGRR